ncbi:MAG TPA: hypothetical protein VKA63_05945 [Candidatus Krumholzibacteria bacterium]|nr:hypothetical protein [Candidatus Krumholzibacteria bacterium]
MKRVCAWCDLHLGTKDGEGVEGVTAGICERCAADYRTRLKAARRKRLQHEASPLGTGNPQERSSTRR